VLRLVLKTLSSLYANELLSYMISIFGASKCGGFPHTWYSIRLLPSQPVDELAGWSGRRECRPILWGHVWILAPYA
jgi:hypothetical protein